MKNTLTLEAFAEFCESKPEGERYWFLSSRTCACGQYAEAIGTPVIETLNDQDDFWNTAQILASKQPWTFGYLANRVRDAALAAS